MVENKYNYTLGELVDRLTIVQLKETFNPELREQYAKEISDICHDINILLPDNPYNTITAEVIRDIIILAQYNTHIWMNEDLERKGLAEGENIDWEAKYKQLRLTHSLNNGVRNVAKNRIQSICGGRKEHKNISLAVEHEQWRPSGY